MKNYVKPMVLANEELAEGVYAGSGVSAGSAGVSCSDITETYTGNQWNPYNNYDITVKNNTSTKAESWTVTLNVAAGTAESVVCNNAQYASVEKNGNQIVITSGPQAALESGAEIVIPIVVKYSSAPITLSK